MTIVGSGNSMVKVAPIDTGTDNSIVDKLGKNSSILSNSCDATRRFFGKTLTYWVN